MAARFVIHFVRPRKTPVGHRPLAEQRALGMVSFETETYKPGLEVNVANGPNAPKRAFVFAYHCPLGSPFAPKALAKTTRQAEIGDLLEDHMTGEWYATTSEGVVKIGERRPLKHFQRTAPNLKAA